jgi:hypothetical protein
MVPAILVATSHSEPQNDSPIQDVSLDTHQKLHPNQLVMKWTLDENSKLTCQWINIQH